MAQNISIQEGGQAKQFGQVNKLKISDSDGNDTFWIAEDDVPTQSLYVDSNGVYEASEDGVYGYDEVSVNILDEVYAYDDDFDEYYIWVDEDEELEEAELPTYIDIVTPPQKSGKYEKGEKIKLAGIVVKAYYEDGTEYEYDPDHNNVISLNELIYSPKVSSGEEAEKVLIKWKRPVDGLELKTAFFLNDVSVVLSGLVWHRIYDFGNKGFIWVDFRGRKMGDNYNTYNHFDLKVTAVIMPGCSIGINEKTGLPAIVRPTTDKKLKPTGNKVIGGGVFGKSGNIALNLNYTGSYGALDTHQGFDVFYDRDCSFFVTKREEAEIGYYMDPFYAYAGGSYAGWGYITSWEYDGRIYLDAAFKAISEGMVNDSDDLWCRQPKWMPKREYYKQVGDSYLRIIPDPDGEKIVFECGGKRTSPTVIISESWLADESDE